MVAKIYEKKEGNGFVVNMCAYLIVQKVLLTLADLVVSSGFITGRVQLCESS